MSRCYFRLVFSFFLFFVSFNSFAQDVSYYNTLSVSDTSFVSALQTRIRAPFQKRTYTEFRDIMIPNYESTPINSTQRRVFCAYSGFTYDYTPPFAFGSLFSREHTYCQSWWDVSSTSNPYYSDFHHLFLTQQPNANSIRSNHPLGNVVNSTSTFLECKLGTNASGYMVFEPRAIDKGDAARAMLYMVLRYDKDGTYGNWTLKWLNETKLPNLPVPEGPQDINTLLTWAKQDPPDKWEIERNNYIATLQLNRNPFIDHPEYLKYINFYDLSKLNPVFSSEPTNQVGSLTAVPSGNSITVSWTNPTGTQLPEGYLLLAYNKDDYFFPADGDVYTNAPDLSTGKSIVNIANDGTTSYTFTNLSLNTHYYFTMFSYNGNDSLRNYKLDPVVRKDISTESTLPVELVSFTAAEEKGIVTLNWQTATELNNSGFEIERGNGLNNEDELIYKKIAFVNGAENSMSNKKYSYSDHLNTAGKYLYRLKQIDNDGTYKISSAVVVNFNPLIKGYTLEQNYPNPFNPSTMIRYHLGKSEIVKLTVFSSLGESVSMLVDEFQSEGDHEISFSAENISSGVYFYELNTGSARIIKKMTILK